MTYLQLLQHLQQLTPQQLNQDVSIWDNYDGCRRYYGCTDGIEIVFVDEDQRLQDISVLPYEGQSNP